MPNLVLAAGEVVANDEDLRERPRNALPELIGSAERDAEPHHLLAVFVAVRVVGDLALDVRVVHGCDVPREPSAKRGLVVHFARRTTRLEAVAHVANRRVDRAEPRRRRRRLRARGQRRKVDDVTEPAKRLPKRFGIIVPPVDRVPTRKFERDREVRALGEVSDRVAAEVVVLIVVSRVNLRPRRKVVDVVFVAVHMFPA